MDMLDQLFSVSLLAAALRMMTPLLYASLGGLFTDRAGVFNIALEGMLLSGSFAAVIGSYLFESAIMGVVWGILGGAMVGFLFGFFHLRLKADVIVVGVIINLLIMGLTTYLLRSLFDVRTTLYSPRIIPIPKVHIPGLDFVPILGPAINDHTILTYVALGLVPLVWWFVYRTPFGFHLRAAGFRPAALRSAGLDPQRMKYIGSVISGALCGLGGAHLALGYLQQFVEGMSAGRGFIAIAAVAFGNGNPWYILIACFFFGLIDGAAIILQGSQVPSHFLQMLPYIATVILLVIISRQEMKKELG